jgi:hypothetical protein
MTPMQRYQILGTFDIPTISAKLGEHYRNLGEVYRAVSAAYDQLSQNEKSQDYRRVSRELAALASVHRY